MAEANSAVLRAVASGNERALRAFHKPYKVSVNIKSGDTLYKAPLRTIRSYKDLNGQERAFNAFAVKGQCPVRFNMFDPREHENYIDAFQVQYNSYVKALAEAADTLDRFNET